ncbi:hypothetical protein Aperf_G00000034934 [Anoplocephala perfoliata]
MERSRIRDLALKIFSHYSCLPVPISASIRRKGCRGESSATYNVRTKWKQLDSIRNDSIVLDQVYHVQIQNKYELPSLMGASTEIISSFGSCFPYSRDSGPNVLWDVEQDFTRVVFVEYKLPNISFSDSGPIKASTAISGTFVHVFCLRSGKLMKTIKLPTDTTKKISAVHGKVFGSGDTSIPFSSCRFCPTNSKKLVYLAEYLATDEAERDESNSNTVVSPEKSPFIYEETWGEGLSTVVRPVICLLDLQSEEVECIQSQLEKLDSEAKHWSFDDPHLTPDGKGLVFVAYDNEPYRLGMKFCYQRASRLMYWNFESSSLKCLSRDSHAVRWPRFSPDNSKIIWFEIPSGGPHGQCFSLLSLDWPPENSESKVIVPLVAKPKILADFPGLYLCDGVPEKCWTADSMGVVLSTTWGSEKALIHVSLDPASPGRISRFPSPLECIEHCDAGSYGTVSLMDIEDDVVVVRASAPAVPYFLAFTKISLESLDKTSWLNVSLTGEDQPVLPFLKGLCWKVLMHTASIEDTRFGVSHFESILIYPKAGSLSLQFNNSAEFDEKEIKWDSVRGLIVLPHGGPHTAFTAEWLPLLTSYIAAGFACLLVNYRGSVGYGNCSIYSLPGKCGVIDVADCAQATEEALRELGIPNLPCFLYGGSHGGFLVLHLAGRYASLYRAVVARNPVTNLVSMLSTTDIPDWCWTEAGIGLDESKIDPEHPEHLCREWDYTSPFCPTDPCELTRLAGCSPITYVTDKWSVPILLCIGAKDKRVPNEQGLIFMRALKARLGKKANEKMCQTLCFPTEAHPIQSPAAAKDNFVRAIEWYYQALGLVKA